MDPLAQLLGDSPAIAAIREKVRRLLQRPSESRRLPSVLIQGETGTGKGLLARALHAAGPRAAGPFVDVNCAAIPETLLEAEMFGFERGAFTDARQAKAGLFQAAHRGTIFLDEVGLLPEPLQAKLLKVIEDHAVRRLGSTRSEPVDVWIVAATSEDLAAAMRARRFRDDLYHRLAVVGFTLPPLRERGGDVVRLAEHFLARACADYGLPPRALAPAAEAALRGYPWPGNLRELANVMERVALLSEAPRVGPELLGLPGGAPPAARDAPPAGGRVGRAVDAPEAERRQLLEALEASGWNVSRAAGRLGLSRNTIRYRMEKHRLQAPAPTVRETPAADGPATAPAPPTPAPPAPPPPALPRAAPAPVVVRWERRHVTLLRAVLSPASADVPAAGRSQALASLVDKVQTFGGRVEGLSQTGVQAEFGLGPGAAPEDPAGLAAHAAMAIRNAVERARLEGLEPPGVTVALHTGPFLVGRVGETVEIEREAKREAWSLLDALGARAAPHGIVASDGAARFLARRFDLESLPSEEGAPAAYRVATRQRAGFGPDGRVARFVGRREELAGLEAAWAAVRAGRGQVVGIVGEAGVGKSRLVHEFRRFLGRQGVPLLRARCAAYAQATALLPLVDIVKQLGRLREEEPPESGRDKIEHALTALGLAPAHRAALLELTGLGPAGAEADVEPERRRRRAFEALAALGLTATVDRPVAVVIEDLHWVDRSTEEFLAGFLPRVPAAPVMFVVTYRPEYAPPWAGAPFGRIALRELDGGEAAELLAALLPPDVPADTRRAILDRARGNPFYLEEQARAAVEHGGLGPDDPVPETIQGVITARIDRLPEEPRRLLQTASVLGRQVPVALLDAMWDATGGSPDALAAPLAALVRHGFLYERAATDEPVHAFKHALTQEVAYAGLTAGDRQALHAAAAGALERLHADRLPEVYDRLAYHYTRSGDAEKAVHYLTRFAKQATGLYAHAEAVTALQQALAQAERLPAGAGRDRRVVDLALRQARSLFFLGRTWDGLGLLLAQQARLEGLHDPALAARYDFLLARHLSLVGDQARAVHHAERAIDEATACGDEATLGKALYVLAREAYWNGDPARAVEHAREAMGRLARSDERVWLGQAEWVLGVGQAFVGEFETALETLARVERRGESLGEPHLQSYAAVTIGDLRALTGETAAGLADCRRGLELSPDPLNRAVALGYLGHACLEAGDAAGAIAALDEARRQLGEFGIRQMESSLTVWLAEARLLAGDAARAAALAEEALAAVRAGGYQVGRALAERAMGRIRAATGQPAEARRCLERAREAFVANGARFEVGRTLALLAEVDHALGDRATAAGHLAGAAEIFAALRVPAHSARLAALAARLGLPGPSPGS